MKYLNMYKVSKGASAIDFYLISKGEYVEKFLSKDNIPYESIACIGDGDIDESFLFIEGVKMVGAPANASCRIRDKVLKSANGFLSDHSYYNGFEDFFWKAKEVGVEYIFTDFNGVLLEGINLDAFHDLLIDVCKGLLPKLVIVTGASVGQMSQHMLNLGIREAIRTSVDLFARENLIIMCENGAFTIDLLTGQVNANVSLKNFKKNKRIRSEFYKKLEEVVYKEFGFELTHEYESQKNKVFLPMKYTMISVNIPKSDENDNDFRASKESRRFADIVEQEFFSTYNLLENE